MRTRPTALLAQGHLGLLNLGAPAQVIPA